MAWEGYPNPFSHAEAVYVLWKDIGHKHRKICVRLLLISLELGNPAIAPVLSVLCLPQDQAAVHTGAGNYLLKNVGSPYTFGYGKYLVRRVEGLAEQVLDCEF